MKPTSAAVALIALVLAACSQPEPPAPPPKLVRVIKVGAGDTANSTLERSYSGEVRARVETTLGFRIAGKIVERKVDAGQVVKAGQVLARLDPADAALQATQAEAQKSLAAADLARTRDLKAKNFVSAAALDARETAFKAAEAQAALAKNQSSYTTLVADRAGVVGQVMAEPGQVVGAGQAVFRLAPDGEREVAINIPETEVGRFQLGQLAEVRLWSGTDKPLAGRLREIAPAADPATRTFAARVALKDADPRLALGMTALVRFPQAAAGALKLAIPLSAIFQKGDQAAVWKVGADGTASLQPVKVLAWTDAGAVIGEGLAGGETIVAAGANLVTAGEKLRTVQAPAK